MEYMILNCDFILSGDMIGKIIYENDVVMERDRHD